MKKIMCPCCDEIIDYDGSDARIYCPHCFKNISIEQSLKHLANYVSKHSEIGNTMLFEASEYKKARSHFQLVLNVYDDDFDAAKGLILSTILMSTVRSSFIAEAKEEMIRYKDALKVNKLNIEEVTNFIKKVNDYLDEYVTVLKMRLSLNNHFYEEIGKQLYLNALKDVIAFKEVILSFYFSSRSLPLNGQLDKATLKKQIDELKTKLARKYPLESNPLHKLDSDVNETRVEDTIYRDVRKLYQSKTKIFFANIASLLLLFVGIFLIFYFPGKLLIGVPIAGFFALISIALLICQLIVDHKLNQ